MVSAASYEKKVSNIDKNVASKMDQYEVSCLSKGGFKYIKEKYERLGGYIPEIMPAEDKTPAKNESQVKLDESIKRTIDQTIEESRLRALTELTPLKSMRNALDNAINDNEIQNKLKTIISYKDEEISKLKKLLNRSDNKLKLAEESHKKYVQKTDENIKELKENISALEARNRYMDEKQKIVDQHVSNLKSWINDLYNEIDEHYDFEHYLKKEIESEMKQRAEEVSVLKIQKINYERNAEKIIKEERLKKEKYKLASIEATSVAKESHVANIEKRKIIDALKIKYNKARSAAVDAIEAAQILSEQPGKLEIEASDGLLSDAWEIRTTHNSNPSEIKDANDEIFDRISRRYSRVGILVRRNAILSRTVEQIAEQRQTMPLTRYQIRDQDEERLKSLGAKDTKEERNKILFKDF